MNYFSHFCALPRHNDPYLTLGSILPDLLRDSKLNVELHREQLLHFSIGEGILHHIDIDAKFHNSLFFKTFTKAISKSIRDDETIQINRYTYFLAHVLLELYMDHLLISKNREQLDEFYNHFSQISQVKLRKFFFTFFPNHDLELFQLKLSNFVSRRYLYDYLNIRNLGGILSMLFEKVNIGTIEEADQKNILRIINTYKSEIEQEMPKLFNQLNQ